MIIPLKDNPFAPLVARVDRFFEDTKRETNNKRAMVQWYLTPEYCSQIKKPAKTVEFNERLLYIGNSVSRNINAEAIIWKCFLFNFKHRGSVKKQPGSTFFFCRSMFDNKGEITFSLQFDRRPIIFAGYRDLTPILSRGRTKNFFQKYFFHFMKFYEIEKN